MDKNGPPERMSTLISGPPSQQRNGRDSLSVKAVSRHGRASTQRPRSSKRKYSNPMR